MTISSVCALKVNAQAVKMTPQSAHVSATVNENRMAVTVAIDSEEECEDEEIYCLFLLLMRRRRRRLRGSHRQIWSR
jgi:hypothetical protein